MSAAITLFALSELVEQILYHATLANILRSQRVNTTFKRVIDETPRLQEKLFFRAIRPYDSKGNEVEAKCNEVLLQAFGDLQYCSLKHTIKSKTTTDTGARPSSRAHGSALLLNPPQHRHLTVEASVTEWRSTRGGRQLGRRRDLDQKKENPAMLKTLKTLMAEMRKQSRIVRGVAFPNDLPEEATASDGTGGEVDLALRPAASPSV
nr:hypothetical protein B0A51_07160 [Rachicladosporium sp. CCFEE 5018]